MVSSSSVSLLQVSLDGDYAVRATSRSKCSSFSAPRDSVSLKNHTNCSRSSHQNAFPLTL